MNVPLELPDGIEKVGRTVCVHPTARIDRRSLTILRAWVQTDGPPVVVRVEVAADTPPPSLAVREGMTGALLDPRRVLAVALVHVGSGIRAGLIRGVLRGIAKRRTVPPMKVFDALNPAQRWLDGQL